MFSRDFLIISFLVPREADISLPNVASGEARDPRQAVRREDGGAVERLGMRSEALRQAQRLNRYIHCSNL